MKSKGQIRSYSDLQTHIEWQQERCEGLEKNLKHEFLTTVDEQPVVKTYRLINGWLHSGVLGIWGSMAHIGLQLINDVKSGNITKEASITDYLLKLWSTHKPL